MFISLNLVNLLFAIGGLGMLAVALGLYFDYFFNGCKLDKKFLFSFDWQIIMLVTFGGVATTLLYSEYYGFVPCSLCWLQRIALYPQFLLVFLAWQQKDSINFPVYGLALSMVGLIVAIYHYVYQALPTELGSGSLLPCLVDGTSDCATKVMEVFGFVTFPFLSAVLFIFLIILYLNLLKRD